VLAKRIGIDLGASSVLIYVRGQGVVVNEPATPPSNGESDVALTESNLRRLITRIQGRQRIFKPEVMIGVPCSVSSAERRAATEAAIAAGARQAWLIDKPLAAAIGANLPIGEARAHAVCDIGGRTTEIAVISLSGMVVAQSIAVGGKAIDECIRAELKRRHDLFVDDRTAEEIKIAVGSAVPCPEPLTMEVTATVTVRSEELTAAIQERLRPLAVAIRNMLEQAPAQLAADVRERGGVLTGGGALLRGIDRYLSGETGIPLQVADDPQTCVVRGTGLALEHFEVLKRNQLYLR
jgi:rod shape-determining protein MreB